jgi:hypothetical protein
MSKSIVGLIAENQSSEAVSVVNKALAKKLLCAISEQASEVARQAYGTLEEYYGGDEQPDYTNNSDSAYATFFQNALRKFGVTGPEDFKDDVTKQRFFDYVDHNWRAQDSVQNPIQGANGGSMENGTQTQLPAPAAPPQAPIAPTQDSTPTTAQGNDPSVATMAPAGPTINQTAPMGQQGSDPTLNGAQNQQTFTGQGPAADQYAGGSQQQSSGSNFGLPDQNACPYCKGSGKAACPTCGRPHGLDNQQPGAPGGEDQDPNLEIGPEGSEDGMDDEQGLEGGEQDPNGENIDGGMGDESGMEGEEGGDEMGADQQTPGGEGEDVDDPFDDEDAYSIDASDFNGAGGEDDGTGGAAGGEGGEDLGDDEGGNLGGEGEEEGSEDLGDDETGDEEGDEDLGADDEGGEPDDEEDPDLEVGAEGAGDEEGDDEAVVAPKKAPFGKAPAKVAEDFGFGLDNAEDAVFLTEAGLMMQAKPEPVDPGLNKIITYVQQQLSKIKKLRNTMLMQLRRQRAVIKKDPALGPEEKMEALKQLAMMAKDNRKFFKSQAKLVKAMFTGKLAGEDVGAPEEGAPEGEEGMEGQDQEQPQKGGFPPVEGQNLKIRDDEGEGENGEEPEVEDDGESDEKQPANNFPPKKKGFPPAANDDEDEPEADDNGKQKFPKAKGMTEDELQEYESSAAIEGKIKMLHMQISSQGDPGGRRRAALKSLKNQLAMARS